MNDLIILKYEAELLELFKIHYRKMVAKNTQLVFNDVLKPTLEELGLSIKSHFNFNHLHNWFELVHEQAFIKNILLQQIFEEVIFHSHKKIQINNSSHKQIISQNNITDEDYQLSLEILTQKHSVAWNFKEPFASFGLEINEMNLRVTLIHFSTSANLTSKIFLRKLQKKPLDIEQFCLNKDVVKFLRNIINEKKNILISGATGSGKTTLLSSLIGLIPNDEHLIILEDTNEIKSGLENQTSMISRGETNNKSLKDYCAYALRMSPDRLIVGEMRSNEVVPFLLAMNTGHKGQMSTIHANSCVDAISRIALLFSLYSESKEVNFSLITKLACKNIDLVIQIENKKIIEICHIIASEGENPIYEKVYSAS